MTQTTKTPGARPRGPGASPGTVEATLAKGKLGTFMVAFFMVAALGPLLVNAGTLPLAYAATGVTAVPAACVVLALILGVFMVGYLAMSRYIENPGVFYAMIGRGLSRPAGVTAGWLALLAYGCLQLSLFGFIGPQLTGFLHDNFGWNLSWWVCALAVWALVGAFGLAEVNVSATFLGILSIAEIVIGFVIDIMGLIHHPATGGFHPGPFNPARISRAGIGPMAAIITLCFVGVEMGVVYGPEARDAKRTVLRATIVSLIGATVIYVLASWAMDVYYGSFVTGAAGSLGAQLYFGMGTGLATSAGHTLLLTGVIAAMLAFHNTEMRYIFSAARARILPSTLGRVGRSGVPRIASLLQSLLGLGAIGVIQLFQWDPQIQWFYMASAFGGFVIMGLFAVTALAVIVFFWREKHEERAAVRLGLPVLALLLLGGMVAACAANLRLLFGISATDPTITRLYWLLAATVILALGWSAYLRWRDPDAYAKLSGPVKGAAVRTAPTNGDAA
jgi:amino acid transporter